MSRNNQVSILACALALALSANAGAAEMKEISSGTSMAPVAKSMLASHLGLSSASTLAVEDSKPTKNGTVTVRESQMFKGLRVFGATVTTEQDADGNVVHVMGRVAQGLEFDLQSVTPAFSKAQAIAILAKAKGFVGVAAQTLEVQKADLIIMADPQFLGGGTAAKLVYDVSFYADNNGNPTRPRAFIDANTRTILHQFENLQTADATGPGGNIKIGKFEYGSNGKPALNVTQSGSTCTMNNTNVKTVNLNHATSGSTAHSFTCPRNTVKEINGAYSPLNDAHHGGMVIFNMYKAFIDQSPLRQQLMLRVHYSNSYENATWNGSAMTFGDGKTTFHPLVSLDVISHEASHGYTEQNSGLVYSGESGGMNEAYSDIAGEAGEFFDRGTSDMLVGFDIFKSATGALRYMCEPKKDGRSIDHFSQYAGQDVHYTSGIYNKAFCLLSKSPGWDVKKGFQAFARANDLYWTANEKMGTGSQKVLKAACELKFDGREVKKAFDVVGLSVGTVPADCIGGGGDDNQAPVANFTFDVKELTATFANTSTDPNTGDKLTYSWDFGDGNTSTEASPAHTYGKGGTYTVKLTASDGKLTNVKTASVTVTGGTDPGGELKDGGSLTISGAQESQNFYTMTALNTGTATISTAGGGDADLYVKIGSKPSTSDYACRPYLHGSAETCNVTVKAGDVVHVMVVGYLAYSNVTLSGKTSGGTGNAPFGNSTDYPLTDYATVESAATASGTGNGRTNSQVQVAIVHSYIGDLKVTLMAPSGREYVLHNRSGGSADNINMTYTVDLSAEPLSGSWKLRVYDAAKGDTGSIDSWLVTP